MSGQAYITVTQGIGGWFAVLVDWDDEVEAYEPYHTGVGRYANKEDAVEEAKVWAEAEEMTYINE